MADFQSLSLAGTWKLRTPDANLQVPMSLPGDIHSALLAAGRIPDPYAGMGEDEVRWVGRTDWILERDVVVPSGFPDLEMLYLELGRVEGFCRIEVNGREVGEVESAFRRHRLDVKGAMRVGENRIRLHFRAPETELAERKQRLSYPIPHTRHGPKLEGWNLVRQPMCHAGWDWGIALQTMGVAGGFRLCGVGDAVRIDHVYTTQRLSGDHAELDVCLEVKAPSARMVVWTASVDGNRIQRKDAVPEGVSRLTGTLRIENPRRWWPNGMGKQELYTLRVEVEGGETLVKRIGFRTLEVENRPDDTGRPLTFRVNGEDVFCKGANWIPADGLTSRQTPARIRMLLESARDANMNMIRVWGGGQYETEAFYELCDELGLLVWQDLMFACALYPADDSFLADIAEEVGYQAKRLRDHPSLALWCGDNECIGALNWFEESRRNRDRHLIDWDRLNRARGEAVIAGDPDRTYWPSSPCAGPGDFSDTFHEDGKGDMHYWAVWHEGKPFEAYYDVKPRFCSEFGYQSFPSLATVRQYCPPEDFNITSPTMEYHQRNDSGNERINGMFARYFRMPAGFEETLYLSQVQQAVAIQTAVEYWRSLRPHCMGALYWQLNDLWPVASWSSLEYDGRWKLLHYHAKRFFAPLLVTARVEDEQQVTVTAVNDTRDAGAATLTWELWTFSGEVVDTVTLDFHLPKACALPTTSLPLDRLAPGLTERRDRFLVLRLEHAGRVAENTVWFAPYKACRLARADVRSERQGGELVLETDQPAFFVAVEQEGTIRPLSDNSLTVLPGRPVHLRLGDPGAGARIRHLGRVG